MTLPDDIEISKHIISKIIDTINEQVELIKDLKKRENEVTSFYNAVLKSGNELLFNKDFDKFIGPLQYTDLSINQKKYIYHEIKKIFFGSEIKQSSIPYISSSFPSIKSLSIEKEETIKNIDLLITKLESLLYAIK